MTRANFRKRSIPMLLTMLVAAGAAAVATHKTAAASTNQGRTIAANFCLGYRLFCISAALDGQTPVEGYGADGNGGICAKPPGDPNVPSGPKYCVPSQTGLLSIRPGTYWLTVDDPLNSHNFELRSCPGAKTPCTAGQGAEQALTPVCNDDPANADVFKCSTTSPYPETASNEIVKTVKVHLTHGWYRIFCDAVKPVVHEDAGMYVDIQVGGVGQDD